MVETIEKWKELASQARRDGLKVGEPSRVIKAWDPDFRLRRVHVEDGVYLGLTPSVRGWCWEVIKGKNGGKLIMYYKYDCIEVPLSRAFRNRLVSKVMVSRALFHLEMSGEYEAWKAVWRAVLPVAEALRWLFD